MLQPILQTADLTRLAKPLYEYKETLTEKKSEMIDVSFDKSTGYIIEKEPQHTEFSYVNELETGNSGAYRPFTISGWYSHEYVEFTKKSILNRLSQELSEWLSKGTDVAIPHVVKIKRLLEENSDYLEQYADTRLLLGALELVFENNEWENLPKQKLQFFKSKIDYLANNDLDSRQINNFLKELHTSKIKVLKSGYGEEKKST